MTNYTPCTTPGVWYAATHLETLPRSATAPVLYCGTCLGSGRVESELMPECKTRADAVRDLAAARGISAYPSPPSVSALLYRLAWDAPAAGDIPRPVLADACDVAAIWPHYADTVWHHAAGATILGRYCCGTPGSHRDALLALARHLREV